MATNAGLSIGAVVNASPGGLVTHQLPSVPVSFADHQVYLSVYEFVVQGSNPPVMVTGNGTTDDSTAIQAAINAVYGTGRTLYFPAGNFLVSTATTISNPGVQMVFGPGAVLSGSQASALLNTGSKPFFARAVMTTVATSTTYTGSGTGVLTFGSNAAIGTQDGVSTLAVGDVVILQGGTLGSCAITAKDVGPYVITQLGSGSLPVILTRPSWWANGSAMPYLAQITVGPEGTLFQGVPWTAWAQPAANVIGTNDPVLYPDRVTQQVTFVAGNNGTAVIANVPIRSATKTNVLANVSAIGGGTNTGITAFNSLTLTPGYIGTGTFTLTATGTALASIAVATTAVVNVTITNR